MKTLKATWAIALLAVSFPLMAQKNTGTQRYNSTKKVEQERIYNSNYNGQQVKKSSYKEPIKKSDNKERFYNPNFTVQLQDGFKQLVIKIDSSNPMTYAKSKDIILTWDEYLLQTLDKVVDGPIGSSAVLKDLEKREVRVSRAMIQKNVGLMFTFPQENKWVAITKEEYESLKEQEKKNDSIQSQNFWR